MGISQIIFTTFQVFKWNKIDEFQQPKVSTTIQKLILIATVDVNLFKSFCFCVKIDLCQWFYRTAELLVFVRNFLISGTITEDCISLFSNNSIYLWDFSSQRHKDYGARK